MSQSTLEPQTTSNDGQLLADFIDHARQDSFSQIVQRHGTMVLAVCRSVLRNQSDAEDAAQAVFLTLVHRASSLKGRPTLVGWLHRVAWYVAARAAQAAATRRRHEQEAARMKPDANQPDGDFPREELHAALEDLPEKYRVILLLHHFEDKSPQEAAVLLGMTPNAAAVRLTRGRQMLRDRLIKRGVTASAVTAAAFFSTQTWAALTPASTTFVTSTTQLAASVIAGQAATVSASATVLALSKGALNMLFWTNVKMAATIGLAVLLVGASGTFVSLAASRNSSTPQRAIAPTPAPVTPRLGALPGPGPGASADPNQLALAAGNNQFALDLYSKIPLDGPNLFFSPYSISTAVAMTYAGARNQTAQVMANTLHFDLDKTKLHPTFGSLITSLGQAPQTIPAPGDQPAPAYQINIANALWGQSGFSFLPDFLNLVEKTYQGKLQSLDFSTPQSRTQALKTINDWVAKQTQDKIQNLLNERNLSLNTRLVLTNAIYFKGDWASAFDKDRTTDASFTTSASREVQAPMMRQTQPCGYSENDQLQAVSIPYRALLSMLILLPKPSSSLSAVEKNLSLQSLTTLTDALTAKRLVDLTIPRFKAVSAFSVKEALISLGMENAFSSQADFSGMTTAAELAISEVIHKAYIAIDEEGTEAAAATAVVEAPGGAANVDDPPPIIMKVDHPFILIIRDDLTGSILFMGKITDPTVN